MQYDYHPCSKATYVQFNLFQLLKGADANFLVREGFYSLFAFSGKSEFGSFVVSGVHWLEF